MFNDPDIAVQWPIPEEMTESDFILSDTDKVNVSFKEYCNERGINKTYRIYMLEEKFI